jgi:hypothetical protein
VDLELPGTVIGDAKFAPNNIIRNHGAQHIRPQIDLRFVPLKLTTTHQQVATCSLHCSATFVVVIPFAKGAVRKSNRSGAGNFGDLIAWTPEGTVGKAYGTPVV